MVFPPDGDGLYVCSKREKGSCFARLLPGSDWWKRDYLPVPLHKTGTHSGTVQGVKTKLYDVMQAVDEALKRTSRASSMVENLNSRLRNYFFLRRSLGDDHLSLLHFF